MTESTIQPEPRVTFSTSVSDICAGTAIEIVTYLASVCRRTVVGLAEWFALALAKFVVEPEIVLTVVANLCLIVTVHTIQICTRFADIFSNPRPRFHRSTLFLTIFCV